MAIFLSDLILPYYAAYDSKQALYVRIKHAGSGISGRGNIADRCLILGRNTKWQQKGRYHVRSRDPFWGRDHDLFARPRRILTHRHSANCSSTETTVKSTLWNWPRFMTLAARFLPAISTWTSLHNDSPAT